jgi:hypothetical protein
MKSTIPEHERLFDEISGKLNELSQKTESQNQNDRWSERLEKMQQHLRISQEELKATQAELQEKIRALDTMSFMQNDMNSEIKKVSEQLEQERMTNSKLSTDLAKSLELNLKLQFEIEEIRTKANNIVTEERKLNQFLTEKQKTLSTELELAQALQNETRLELSKAKDRFQADQELWNKQRAALESKITELKKELDSRDLQVDELNLKIHEHGEEIQRLNEALNEFETHAVQQNDVMKSLSSVAEKKLVELKLALDKKTIESQDYYSHLQQALTQIQVLRQENAALKDYISKLTALHQTRVEVRV